MKRFAMYAALALLLVGGWLLIARVQGATGFPLDDAWIHQTYARNLAQSGQWAFVPGQVSGGSTSPLFTLLLAPGHWLPGEGYRLWTALLGVLALAALGWLAHDYVALAVPDRPWLAWGGGLLVLVEWHLIWAAASGMETALFAALALAVLLLAWHSPLWAGALVGLAMWARPDGVTLLPFVLAAARLRDGDWRKVGLATAGFAVPAAGYLLFNQATSGEVWPTTFYAKQAEYAVLTAQPLLTRIARVVQPPLAGPLLLLLPGWLLAAVGLLRDGEALRLKRAALARHAHWALPLAWGLGYVAAYVLRLPVAYQHGRYTMPAIPALLLAGLIGLAPWLVPGATGMLQRVLSRFWLVTTAVIALSFVAVGSQAFTTDVRIIDEEMVAAAQWLAANTADDALIAVHDIGAVGYFARRPIVDLAGLVSPEVVAFIDDEARLAAHIRQRDARYLMTFADWYATLDKDPRWVVVYESDGPTVAGMGRAPMTIYRWAGD